jgi:ribose transport system ATP-binding protein
MTDSAGSLALEARDITKRFPGVLALDSVTLTVERGEVHGVVGENGAGKSTLMAAIAGGLAPDDGRIYIGGDLLDPVTPQRARELGVAIVHQEPALLSDLTVAENMYLGLGPEHRPAVRNVKSWTVEWLRRWDEDTHIDPDLRVEQLPPEHRFIVEIARAFAAGPKVLILDEPTEHLSAEDVDRLFTRIRAHAAGDNAVIYISHRIHEVKAIADQITVLRDGQARGTHPSSDVTDAEVVNLIVGRSLGSTFPEKRQRVVTDEPDRIEVRGLRGKGFTNVDLTVRPGEIVGFAGIEDNGQRQTLRALAGLERSHGRVAVDGSPVRVTSPKGAARAGLAFLPSDRHREGTFPGLSVAENMSFRNLGEISRHGVVNQARLNRSVLNSIDRLEIKTPSLDTPIDALSGGNQQKALLSAVLATKPRVLLIDEPTQGVDIGAKTEIYRILRTMAESTGMAIIVVSADALELAGICDRILVFSRGRIIEELVGDQVTEESVTAATLTATTTRERIERRLPVAVRWLASDIAPVLLVAAVLVLFGGYTAVTNAHYLTSYNISNTLLFIAPVAMVAMAQATIMMAGGIDISVGPLMGFIVVACSFFLTDANTPGEQLLGWLLVPGIAVAVGIVNWALTHFLKLTALVATLAMFFALQSLSLLLRPAPGGVYSTSLTNGIQATVGPIPILFIAVCVVALVLQYVLTRTRWGLALRATGSEPEVARVVGIRLPLVRLAAFVACSALTAGGAVFLFAQVGSGDPTAGTNYTLVSISAAVIGGASIFGGRGSYVGALAGGVLVQQIIGALPFLNLATQWESYLVGLLTLVAVAAYSKSREIARVAYR